MTEIQKDNASPRHRALVVEDDPAIRRLVTKLLTRRDVDVDAVEDGASAIRQITSVRYSVIVLDLMLPDLSGFEVLEHIRQHAVATPVAVVSAVSNQALTKLDLDIVKLVISKPFDVDEFSKAVVALCHEAA